MHIISISWHHVDLTPTFVRVELIHRLLIMLHDDVSFDGQFGGEHLILNGEGGLKEEEACRDLVFLDFPLTSCHHLLLQESLYLRMGYYLILQMQNTTDEIVEVVRGLLLAAIGG